ncbi:MAG: hypothetical protein KGQ83_11230 [Planctomycetes bacterium]|nr:hypothetical protein [Planctomycetota bacterium]MDE1889539.1 hypothetical protein [Planctomycetota bacterium]
MVVAVSLLLFSGCAGIKPAVKYQPGQQQATPRRYSGPHEAAPIRAEEERVLLWTPELKTDIYTIRTSLVYDLNRYNGTGFYG